VNVLKRAALLIAELGGGEIASEVVDVYPNPQEKKQVAIKYHYLKKLSGKNYHPDAVKNILENLGFEFVKEGLDDLWFAVPFSKPDISLPADIVEEIMRIDGYDNVEIPTTISMAPSADLVGPGEAVQDKVANYLVGLGFSEILTNSITNSKYYSEEVLATGVKMLNNLSADLDMLRPSMLETGLESVLNNLNRKNNHLRFFEFGKTYSRQGNDFAEHKHLSLFVTGQLGQVQWNQAGKEADLFYLKGVVNNFLSAVGISKAEFTVESDAEVAGLVFSSQKTALGKLGLVTPGKLRSFDIKQPVLYADIKWDTCLKLALAKKIEYKELPKFPAVERDLALVLDKSITYEKVESSIAAAKIGKLSSVRLFDVFESEKLGTDKKSLAINFTFLDAEKTLTDTEVEGMMGKLMKSFEKELGAEIRK
jgi:phenylalanyl-tRNA synthetase beta chain